MQGAGYSKNKNRNYVISWISNKTGESKTYNVTTNDFKTYSETVKYETKLRNNSRKRLIINNDTVTGIIHKVSWNVIDNLIKTQQITDYQTLLANEYFTDDMIRFKDLKPVDVKINADVLDTKKISDQLIGVFFEDINYAADGGLYAELVQNRDFEYNLADKKGKDVSWTSTKAWSLTDSSNATLTIDTVLPIHINNQHYAVLRCTKTGVGLVNEGFDGIVIKAGEKYNFQHL